MDTLEKDVYYYALRLTPKPNTEAKVKFCRERIPAFISSIGGINYLYGQEYEKNHHFHIVFSHLKQFDTTQSEEIDNIKSIMYDIFEVTKKKQGNPTYSMEAVRKLDEALSYAVKGGNYDCSEQWKLIAQDAYENSHEKTYSMKSSLADLTDKYIKDEIYEKDLWVGLGQSRADLGLPLSLRWVDEMFLSIQCKKDPDKLKELWDLKIAKEAIKQEKFLV